jgi:hypothetical protein
MGVWKCETTKGAGKKRKITLIVKGDESSSVNSINIGAQEYPYM